LFAVEQTLLVAAQCTAIPSKSAAVGFGGGLEPKAAAMSPLVFSSSMSAIDTAPTLNPARVNATHGAGAFLPSGVTRLNELSNPGLTTSVQYVKAEGKLSKNFEPGGLKMR
jgi:hypothetical protein